MRVLSEGKPWSVEVTCTGNGNNGGGCKARLEAERSDLRYYSGTDHPLYRPEAVVVRCPLCGTITDLETKDWPPRAHSLTAFSLAWAAAGEPNDR